MKKKSNQILWTLFVVVFLLVLGGGCYSFYLYKLYLKPNFKVENGQQVELFIHKNTTFIELMTLLEDKNALIDPSAFKKMAQLKGLPSRMKTGHYVITNGMTNRTVVNKLLSGAQNPVKLTFNNIRFKSELAHKISTQLELDSTEVMLSLMDASNYSKYSVNSHTIMGLFIPNTYEVYWTISSKQLLARMHKEYIHFWNKKRTQLAQNLHLDPLQIITIASIVEEETNKWYEKPIVAGLYLNRLKRGIPLQSDPTVRFAIGNFGVHRILYEHLKYESPYNTYLHAGLPPGPIRLASIQGIDAVLNSKKHSYIYMCAKPSLNGEHNFAVTLRQHNHNAQLYHRALRIWERKNKN